MSASFFDLQKFAATGIAAPDMTAYDKARALAAFGSGKTQTLTGVPPLTFKADGTPLISWSMLGNGQQTGTPTPDAPIMPEFVGVRTGQLCTVPDISVNMVSGYYRDKLILENIAVGSYTLSADIHAGVNSDMTIGVGDNSYEKDIGTTGASADGRKSISFTISTEDAGKKLYARFVRFYAPTTCDYTVSNIMLNSGSTALPYEPFGYKIPITNAGQTVPVYLGQTQTVRSIKKLVLTGGEAISRLDDDIFYHTPEGEAAMVTKSKMLCTHFVYSAYGNIDAPDNSINSTAGNQKTIWFKKTGTGTSADFKAYLAQQYAAGTPVIIWYVLNTPQTAIVNEPLAKIGGYADELHSSDAGVTIPTAKGANTLTVDTELQPSSMSVTGRIKSS